MTVTTVRSLTRISFSQHRGDGVLTEIAEKPSGVPFRVRRVFVIAGVSAGSVRGDHAHRNCTQMLICLAGEVTVATDDGSEAVTDTLLPDGTGLVIPPMLWNRETFRDPGSILAVFCDELFDEEDYIRGWDEYVRLKAASDG